MPLTELAELDEAAMDMITVKGRGCLTLSKNLLRAIINIGSAVTTSP